MNTNDILDSLNKYILEFPYDFYNFAKTKFENQNNTIKLIPNDLVILESIRVHICYNQDKYTIYFTNKVPQNYCYRELNLSETQFDNLFRQIKAIDGNDMKLLCSDTKIKFTDPLFVVFTDDKLNDFIYKTNEIYKVGSVVLGNESLYFLKHQRIDRLCDIFNSDSSNKIYHNIREYIRELDKLTWIDREKMLLFSGMILQCLGTTQTEDLDILIVNPHIDDKYIAQINNMLKDVDADKYFLMKNKHWLSTTCTGETKPCMPYQQKWLCYELPQLCGAEDIWQAMSNNDFHFHFMGMKLMSIAMVVQRLLARARASAYVDLLALEMFNKIEIFPKPCIPNMSIFQSRIIIYDDDTVNKLYDRIQKYFLDWHEIKLDISFIKSKIKRCNDENYMIYSGSVPVADDDIKLIKQFHTAVKDYYIQQYCYNKQSLCDIGAGRLVDVYSYIKAHINKIVAIEPSIDSVEYARKRIETIKYKPEIIIINGKGDDDFFNDDKYSPARIEFDCIVFQFTIHYMLKKMNILMNNLSRISKKGTILIISYLNGEKLLPYLNKCKKYEVYNEPKKGEKADIIFGVYKFNNNDEILTYMKSAYGLSIGSTESITKITEIAEQLDNIGFKLIENKPYSQVFIPIRKRLSRVQLRVSDVYSVAVFEKQ
jgi:hypothetical protein